MKDPRMKTETIEQAKEKLTKLENQIYPKGAWMAHTRRERSEIRRLRRLIIELNHKEI